MPEWIPVRTRLRDEPEVLAISARTGRSREEVVGFLCALWGWASEVTEDGRIPSASKSTLVGVIGADAAFWEAVDAVEWLVCGEGEIAIPRYERWLSKSAKRRAKEARRKRLERAESVRKLSASGPQNGGKKIELHHITSQDIIPPTPPKGAGGGSASPTTDERVQVLERLRGFYFSWEEAERIQAELKPQGVDLDAWSLVLHELPKHAPKVQNRLAYVKDLMRTHRHPRDAGLTWIDEAAKASDPEEKRRAEILKELRFRWTEGLWSVKENGIDWKLEADGLHSFETRSWKPYRPMSNAELEAVLTRAVRESPATQEEVHEQVERLRKSMGGGGGAS